MFQQFQQFTGESGPHYHCVYTVDWLVINNKKGMCPSVYILGDFILPLVQVFSSLPRMYPKQSMKSSTLKIFGRIRLDIPFLTHGKQQEIAHFRHLWKHQSLV